MTAATKTEQRKERLRRDMAARAATNAAAIGALDVDNAAPPEAAGARAAGGGEFVERGVEDENYLMPGQVLFLTAHELWKPEYQRKLQQPRVNRMARQLDPRLLGVLFVAQREGHYYVIDGMHRLSACLTAGYGNHRLRCLVLPVVDYNEEAELFVMGNNRENTKPLTTGEVFHARMEQGDEIAQDIARLAGVAGLTLDLSMDQSTTDPHTVRAVATLERVYRNGGPEHLADVLATIQECFPLNREALVGDMITGMHQFLWRYHARVDREHLRKTLNAVGIEGVGARGAMARAATWHRHARSGQLFGQAILDLYNDSRGRGQRLPSWDLMPELTKANRRTGVAYYLRSGGAVMAGEPLHE